MCKKIQFKYCPSKIDKCIQSFILSLQSTGFKTLSCCCGHGIYPLTVVIETHSEGRKPFNVELISGKIIPRKRNFYKKDDKGFYYIPETLTINDYLLGKGK